MIANQVPLFAELRPALVGPSATHVVAVSPVHSLRTSVVHFIPHQRRGSNCLAEPAEEHDVA
jgi:hypothetical protein